MFTKIIPILVTCFLSFPVFANDWAVKAQNCTGLSNNCSNPPSTGPATEFIVISGSPNNPSNVPLTITPGTYGMFSGSVGGSDEGNPEVQSVLIVNNADHNDACTITFTATTWSISTQGKMICVNPSDNSSHYGMIIVTLGIKSSGQSK